MTTTQLRAELAFALAALEDVDRDLGVLGLTYTSRPYLQDAIERLRKAVSGAVVGAPDSTPAGRSHSPGTESVGKGGARCMHIRGPESLYPMHTCDTPLPCSEHGAPVPQRLGVARAELRTFVSAAAIEEYVAAAIEAREKEATR